METAVSLLGGGISGELWGRAGVCFTLWNGKMEGGRGDE